jgi:hypothetical protein
LFRLLSPPEFAHDRGVAKTSIGYAYKQHYSKYTNGICKWLVQDDGWTSADSDSKTKIEAAIKFTQKVLGLSPNVLSKPEKVLELVNKHYGSVKPIEFTEANYRDGFSAKWDDKGQLELSFWVHTPPAPVVNNSGRYPPQYVFKMHFRSRVIQYQKLIEECLTVFRDFCEISLFVI